MPEIDAIYFLLFCFQTLKLALILAVWHFRITYPKTISCRNVSLVIRDFEHTANIRRINSFLCTNKRRPSAPHPN